MEGICLIKLEKINNWGIRRERRGKSMNLL